MESQSIKELKIERWEIYGRQQRKIGQIRATEHFIRETAWLKNTARFNAIVSMLEDALALYIGDLAVINEAVDDIKKKIKELT
jgi:hypothetical protein